MGERLSIVIVLVTLFLTVGTILRTLIENWRRGRMEKLQADLISRMIDKFGNAPEMLTYLQSEAGRVMVHSATATPIGSTQNRILNSVQAGCVLLILGFGLQILKRSIEGEAHDVLLIVGGLGIALGVGLLVSAFLSYSLSRSWGLFKTTGLSTREE